MKKAKKVRTTLSLVTTGLLVAGMLVWARCGVKATGPTRIATFAGGCFWCMEPPFEKLPGVRAVISGYTGGKQPNPKYKDVAYGRTSHLEAVQVHYDPRKITYARLVEVFWRQIDPTDPGGQFVDRGKHYRTAIFYHDRKQYRIALASKQRLSRSKRFKRPIVTELRKATTFYRAEEYHQDYYKKSPGHYYRYRRGSGRDQFIKRHWSGSARAKIYLTAGTPRARYKKPADAVLRKRLTRIQYHVTQRDGTERPFRNKYWNNKRPGIYVDIVSGEPLFSSTHKYRSGTGWPSFWKPLEANHIVRKEDRKYGMLRVEVRSKYGDSHLGHLFRDGPRPTGLRYCINSAALRFIPVDQLKRAGYAKYLPLFQKK